MKDRLFVVFGVFALVGLFAAPSFADAAGGLPDDVKIKLEASSIGTTGYAGVSNNLPTTLDDAIARQAVGEGRLLSWLIKLEGYDKNSHGEIDIHKLVVRLIKDKHVNYADLGHYWLSNDDGVIVAPLTEEGVEFTSNEDGFQNGEVVLYLYHFNEITNPRWKEDGSNIEQGGSFVQHFAYQISGTIDGESFATLAAPDNPVWMNGGHEAALFSKYILSGDSSVNLTAQSELTNAGVSVAEADLIKDGAKKVSISLEREDAVYETVKLVVDSFSDNLRVWVSSSAGVYDEVTDVLYALGGLKKEDNKTHYFDFYVQADKKGSYNLDFKLEVATNDKVIADTKTIAVKVSSPSTNSGSRGGGYAPGYGPNTVPVTETVTDSNVDLTFEYDGKTYDLATISVEEKMNLLNEIRARVMAMILELIEALQLQMAQV